MIAGFGGKTEWTFLGNDAEKSRFGGFVEANGLGGELVSKDPISSVRKLALDGTTYYIKEYNRNGKGVRHYFGRGRLQGEWENLLYFESLDIPIPRVVAYGQQHRFGQFEQGLLITAEVPLAQDLLTLSRTQPQLFHHGTWLTSVSKQVADYTRRLHHQGFVHWDLKWRNVLVSLVDQQSPQVYFFDCPLGRQRIGWLRRRGIIKDLACLDKVASKALSRSRRLAFFLSYKNVKSLSPADKKSIRQILGFFAAEEP